MLTRQIAEKIGLDLYSALANQFNDANFPHLWGAPEPSHAAIDHIRAFLIFYPNINSKQIRKSLENNKKNSISEYLHTFENGSKKYNMSYTTTVFFYMFVIFFIILCVVLIVKFLYLDHGNACLKMEIKKLRSNIKY